MLKLHNIMLAAFENVMSIDSGTGCNNPCRHIKQHVTKVEKTK